MRQDEKIIRTGTWLYAGTAPTQVTLVRREVTYGSGDYEDPPEICEDRAEPCFVIRWGSPGEPGISRSASAQYASIDEALREADILAPGIKWSEPI
jgi:hypothetical protein